MEMLLRKKNSKVVIPKAGMKYQRLLHDNAPAHKAPIVTGYFEEERISSSFLSQPLIFPNFPYRLLSFPQISKSHRIKTQNAFVSGIYQYMIGIPALLRNMKILSRSGLYPGQG